MMLTETGAIPAAALPVQALSEHLRLGHGFSDDGAEDALLERLLRQAVSAVEQRTGLALIRRGFELEVAAWNRNGHLVLPVGPVAELQSLVLWLDDLASPLASSQWRLAPAPGRQKVTGPYGGSLPPLTGDLVARITFDAGFGADWTEVPGDLARAVLMLAAHGYDHRSGDAEIPGIPAGVMALIDLRRQVRL